MIKLLCPVCQSDEICTIHDSEGDFRNFECEECGSSFDLSGADWEEN